MAKRPTRSISPRRPRAGDIDWNRVIKRAHEVVDSYSTGVTLRQLYYRLVSEGLIPNNQNHYKMLSRKTAQARREGWFPALIDRTRAIERHAWWHTAQDSFDQMLRQYRIDRTEGQPWSIYIGVEKHGMTVQLMSWFGHLGIPILALGGYSSQTFVDVVKAHIERQERQSVLLYAGDFDPSGEDIDRDFEERTEIFDKVVRVALSRKHLDEYNLPPMPGKASDARAEGFVERHGELMQVELDALRPEDLRKLYKRHVDKHWDKKAYDVALEREDEERDRLVRLQPWVNEGAAKIATSLVSDLSDEDIMDVMDSLQNRLAE